MSGTTLTPQKAELIVRILVQNGLLIVAVLVFAALGAGLVAWPTAAWPLCLVHAVASGALLLQWCHHGVRTMQIKAFLLETEGRDPMSWEVWLPAHRPRRLLGTRWFVSTKGVFLGTQASLAILSWWVAPAPAPWAMAACAGALAASTVLLLTNPKE